MDCELAELLSIFGLPLSSTAKSLPSYEDKNFLVSDEVKSKKYVLKKYRSGTSEEFIKFQNMILATLMQHEINVPKVFFNSFRILEII
jgi:Ser/Thr protein kinase RdoA (MazF antagonist)